MRIIATVILLFAYILVSGQSKDWNSTYIKISTLEKSGHFKVWELYPMDSSHLYFMYVRLTQKKTSKQDKKIYSRLMRVARQKKPQGLYLIFQKREVYSIDTALNNSLAGESSLVIEETDLRSYLEMIEILNPPIKDKLLRKRLLVFNVKKGEKYEISHY